MTSQLLDEDDKANIETAIARLDAIAPELERARNAGFDIKETEERMQKERAKLRGIRQAFFPDS